MSAANRDWRGGQIIYGRKYHLDWLRVLAFGLLIPFHVGPAYASWFCTLKNPRPAPPATILPVYVLHQPILFAAAYAILPLRLPLEAELLVCVTFAGAVALYHFAIRSFGMMRFVFGLKTAAVV